MNSDEAVQSGAMALFGEKYGDEVRVVSMGHGANAPYSIELCGGTHVHNTGEIGLFKITSEASVASGIRRIEAITSFAVLDYAKQNDLLLNDIMMLFKTNKRDLMTKVQNLLDHTKKQSVRFGI